MSLNANGANAGELESSPTSGVVENKVLFFLLLCLSLPLSYDDNDDDHHHHHHKHYHYHHYYNSIISITNMLLPFMVLVILFLVCT